MQRNMQQSKPNKGRTIILDACALKSQEAMQIIDEAQKVIVLMGTIEELDKHKNRVDEKEKRNIRYIAKKIREDVKSEKYVCIANYNKYRYNDDNIIDYCMLHSETIILTCDNLLCGKAKGYKIPYIFPKIEKDSNVSTIDDSDLCNIKGVNYRNEWLAILRDTLIDPYFNVIVIRNGKMMSININRNLTLKISDIVIRIWENSVGVDISIYEIKKIKSSRYAENIEKIKLKYPIAKSIKKADLPEKVKKEICLLVNCEEYKEESNKEEIYLENGNIYLSKAPYNSYIGVERNKNFIKNQKCKEGDIIYLVKFNKKRGNLTMHEYRVKERFNIQSVQKTDSRILKGTNAIYSLNCSDQLKDDIFNFYAKYIKY